MVQWGTWETTMTLKALILGATLTLGTACSAFAAGSDLIDGNDVNAILELARGYGETKLEKQDNGDPKIKGDLDGITYAIYFMNCTDNKDCEDLNFYAGFLDLKPEMDVINSWNRDKRFGKAYLDSDGDAVVEMDLNLEHGISSDNLDADISVWSLVVEQYAEHIGYEK
ncbi:YbjN domain-containing protein [Devosia sp. D6-9]|nr:YbjN domain-containing protein [Devosia sp. D6-9]